MVMFLCVCMALGAVLAAVLFFRDARRGAGRRKQVWTVLMYLTSALSALAAAVLTYLACEILDALLTIF